MRRRRAGPLLGGVLVESVGWRAVFWVSVPIAVATLFATRLVRESSAGQARRFDLPGQVLVIVSLGTLTYALIDAPRTGWGSPGVITLLVAAAVSGGLFLTVERRSPHPLLAVSAFHDRTLSGAVALAVVAFLALGGFIFFNTLYLQDVRGLSPLTTGLLTVPTPALVGVCVVVSALAFRVAPRENNERERQVPVSIDSSARL